ncbi:DUF5683 domain-containing protein [Pedobacter sp. JCM 36344]|uniref:DUF5683 domain-containing protein n=1 Tax=Pedobacter sp. JCM 36344 TaxID=3374280 RepID=UPI00397E79E8
MGKLIFIFLLFTAYIADAQVKPVPITVPPERPKLDTLQSARTDTLKPKYINRGKIQGRRAAISSAIFPGLGQIRNGITFYRLLKIGGIYTGATLLTLSYIDNSKKYKDFLQELEDRAKNGGKPDPNSLYAAYPDAGLIAAKDNARRNREVVIFSMAGLYLLNIIEAYIDARLKYFDVGEVTFKVSPSLLNTGTMYGFSPVSPGLKITIAL